MPKHYWCMGRISSRIHECTSERSGYCGSRIDGSDHSFKQCLKDDVAADGSRQSSGEWYGVALRGPVSARQSAEVE